MDWFSQLSWWQITLIVIVVVWVGTFLLMLEQYQKSVDVISHFFIREIVWVFFFLTHPYILMQFLWHFFARTINRLHQPQAKNFLGSKHG